MQCYRPLQAWYGPLLPSGKRSIVWKREKATGEEIQLPCGRCIGCKLNKSRIWAMRCMFEASLHEDNCFITLTYADEHIPKDYSLNVKEFQDFIGRLRKFVKSKKHEEKYGYKVNGIRYFHCGEYGEKLGRPHYHACIFGYDFQDKELLKVNNGNPIYISKDLNALWEWGHSSIGQVTFESAAYVARYITKKITGDIAKDHYEFLSVDHKTGEIIRNIDRKPEYTTMSRRPGIAGEWIEKFMGDVYPKDYVKISGRGNMRPPRFFDNKFELIAPEKFQELKNKRKEQMNLNSDENTEDRLLVKEKCLLEKVKILKRELE